MKKHTLWVEKFRPTNIDTYLGNEDFVEGVREWIEKNDFPNLLLFGTAGTGKTTAAKLITSNVKCDYIYINCSDENGIDTIREKVKSFASAASFQPIKIVVLDEADFLTINAQAALRNVIETFSLNTRFIFTCNYVERIIEPLQSRLALYRLETPSKPQVLKHIINILDQENITYTKEILAKYINNFYPDIRRIINSLQSSVKNNIIVDSNLQTSNPTQQVIDEINKRAKDSFTKIRQIVADANLRDFTELYRALYDNTKSASDIIIIAEGQYQSVTAVDKEINFMSTVAKLLS
jgi:DNA polymerase III delta prime subunit